MLFSFDKFWKTIGLLVATWIAYGIWGYEFCVITLLVLLISVNFEKTDSFI